MKFRGCSISSRKRLRLLLQFLALTFALGFAVNNAKAQTATAGTVAGQVTDESSAAVPGASVKVIEVGTKATQSLTTNEAGRYLFSQVPPGVYNIVVSKEGFSTYEVNNQSIEVGAVLTINAKMKVGSTATTIEVTAATGAELQTMNATVGNAIDSKSMVMLPNLGRDVVTLAVLQPGVTLSGYAAGSQNEQNTFTLDGGSITDDMAGNTTGYQTNYTGFGGTQTGGVPSGVLPTPIDSIEEVRVATIGQTSDFANSSGSQIQMVTKRGQNAFHGTGYMYYYDTTIGSANSWSGNHTPATINGVSYTYTPIISNHRTRFGGSIGGPLTPKPVLGGKWYFFFNYEALRFPNVGATTKTVPSALLRAGIIQEPNSAGTWLPYNINPTAVTVGGVTYAPAACPVGQCDPRGIGISPVVSKIWNNEMPLPNSPNAAGDHYNTQGYIASIRAPQTSNNYVGRIDHDFSEKWRFYGTYRDYRLINLTTNQVDFGGVLGGTLGQPLPVAPRPQQPSFWSSGLTTQISPSMTNNFVFSYTRSFWQWGSQNAPPQLPGLGGAIEPGGESSSALIPYNINTQSVRQRFWDGQDKLLRDDLTFIHGNHIFGFGGSYQRNFDYHSRTDNGNGINNAIVYQLTSSGINFNSPAVAGTSTPYLPTTVASSSASSWNTFYSEVTGMVSQSQVAYTRSGTALNLNPVGSSAYDKSVIPYYAEYFYDTWHVKPTLTLTYGLGYNLEMPPLEQNGKQTMIVGTDGSPIITTDYIARRQALALQGQAYQPNVGFALVGNVGSGRKYPYDPYYGEFSPRFSFAWNPTATDGVLGKLVGSGKTVLRGGYARIWGRLNGVNLVLSPLLGVGLIQPVTCNGATSTGQCLGSGATDPTTNFRIGVDGMTAPLAQASPTLAQPFFPGIGGNVTAGDVSALDPHYKPDRTDQFTLTIQRELSRKVHLEVGYIGKILRNETTELDLDGVPYMMTLGGQSFSQAFANTYWSIWGGGTPAVQPFFENALGGTSSGFCAGFGSCTAALVSRDKSLFQNTQVSDLWLAMTKANGWTLGRTMISSPVAMNCPAGAVNCTVTAAGQATSISESGSLGWGNYNAAFATLRLSDFHGITATSNFTYGRALGVGTVSQYSSAYTEENMYDLHSTYGPQSFDIKFIYNLSMVYQPPYYRSQKGVVGHVLGGWTIAPLFTAQSGSGMEPSYSESNCTACQAFGEVGNSAAAVSSVAEGAVGLLPYTGSVAARYNNYGANGVGTNSPYGLNIFAHPDQIIGEFRPCVLGYDTSCGGYYNLRGLPTWNLDLAVTKDIALHTERVGLQLNFQFTNVLNHFQPGGPGLSLSSPTSFGAITGAGNTPRQLEFGLRAHF